LDGATAVGDSGSVGVRVRSQAALKQTIAGTINSEAVFWSACIGFLSADNQMARAARTKPGSLPSAQDLLEQSTFGAQ
jgi:hypothetical protein